MGTAPGLQTGASRPYRVAPFGKETIKMKHTWLLLLPLFAACIMPPPRPLGPPLAEKNVKPGINDNFLSADLNVAEFVERFEGESREIALNRDAIVSKLGLRPGNNVADIGSGTGLFLAPLCEKVGQSGTVFAVDLSPQFLEHLRERKVKENLYPVEVVECTERSVELPERSVDVAIVVDTYHHFEYPQNTLWSLRRALRPGGYLYVVDFERIPGVSREWLLDHVRADKETFRAEIEEAGFTFVEEVDLPGLVENYMLRFRRL